MTTVTVSEHRETQLSIREEDVFSALQNSVYPGAKLDSIKMVLSYCKAANLDPIQKPVHIVPMSVKDSLSQKYSYRDVIMPGIGLYRIQAHRSNQYGGITAPEYGPILTLTNGSEEFAFPEWCKITVKRIVDSVSTDFTAKEYWIENYATAGKDTIAPNAMWKKRPYGQLAKCAEAQALRKAFPEIVSQAPTFEELKPDFDVNCKLAEIKEKPILNQESPRWARAVQQLAENKITIEEIKNYVVLGEEDEEEMIFQSDELAAKLNEEQQEEKE